MGYTRIALSVFRVKSGGGRSRPTLNCLTYSYIINCSFGEWSLTQVRRIKISAQLLYRAACVSFHKILSQRISFIKWIFLNYKNRIPCGKLCWFKRRLVFDYPGICRSTDEIWNPFSWKSFLNSVWLSCGKKTIITGTLRSRICNFMDNV